MTPEQRELLSDPDFTSDWSEEYAEALEAALEDSRQLAYIRSQLRSIARLIDTHA